MEKKSVIFGSVAIVLCLAVIIGVIVLKNNYKKSDLGNPKNDEPVLDNENMQSENVFVVISINPKLMLKIKDNKIIDVYQLNNDSIIFTNDKLKGLDVEKGIEKIIDISKENNYITDDTEVKVSLYENTNDKDNVIDAIKSKFNENNIEIISYTMNNQEIEEIKNIVTNYKEQIKEEIKTYTINFDSDGGSAVSSQTIEENNKVAKPSNPTKSGYEFLHWAYNDKEFDFNTVITSDITLVAIWHKKEESKPQEPTQPIVKKTYTVTFNSNGGSAVSSQTIEENNKVAKPSNPTKSGYEFSHWAYDNKEFDFNTNITSDITLLAVWNKKEEQQPTQPIEKKKYTVTFNSNGGSAVSSKTVEENTKVTKPTNPTRNGFTFLGWYYNNSQFDFNTKITNNLTLIAEWKENMIEKEITEEESIPYTTKEVQEVNMLRGTKTVTQTGKTGKKNITYKVVYNSQGKEVSREKIFENVVEQPTEGIVKIGVSDYNLNSDKVSYGAYGVYCLDEDLIDVEADIPACVGTFSGYFNIIRLKNITYIHSYSVGETSMGNAVFNDVRPLLKLTKVSENWYTGILNGVHYNFQFLMGSGEPPSETLIIEQDCTKYDLACGRW